MEQLNDYQLMLEMISAPAFTAKDGKVQECNNHARMMMIFPGDPVAPMLGSFADVYQNHTANTMSVTLHFDALTAGASITKLSDRDLFRIEEKFLSENVKGMIIFGNRIRQTISSFHTYAEKNKDGITPDMRRDLTRLYRMLNNLNHVQNYAKDGDSYHGVRNLHSVFEEVLAECKDLLTNANIRLLYNLPKQPTFSLCDPQMLCQAVYNLIGNAARCTSANETIEVSFTESDNQLLLSVITPRPIDDSTVQANFFSCHEYENMVYDGVYGLGLGMTVVRIVAAAHGGAVLMDQTKDQKTRITMSLAIRDSKRNTVHCPLVTVVPARDDGMVMLSDVLPSSMYQ